MMNPNMLPPGPDKPLQGMPNSVKKRNVRPPNANTVKAEFSSPLEGQSAPITMGPDLKASVHSESSEKVNIPIIKDSPVIKNEEMIEVTSPVTGQCDHTGHEEAHIPNVPTTVTEVAQCGDNPTQGSTT